MGQHVVGIDLGQTADFTAISVIERLPKFEEQQKRVTKYGVSFYKTVKVEQPPHLHCRQLQRVELGTKYPVIVAKTKAMLSLEALRGALLVVDGTGVGRAVIDMFRAAGLRPIAVNITGGSSVHFDEGYWYVPKRDLVAAVQVPLQDKRLLFAQESEFNEVLVKEMLDFKVKITESANDTYGAWREGQHDDLLFSVMLASWAGQKFKPRKQPTSREY